MRTEPLTVRVPGDKSLTHRALLLAGLATGRSTVRRPLVGADTASTAAALRALGCQFESLEGDRAEVIIHGRGLRGLMRPHGELYCGNSGTTARLLMGILAGQPFEAVLTGDASLRARPMRRVTAPLTAMGARFEELGGADRLPVRVHGRDLRPIDYESPHASAQVKSAILLAALVGGVPASVVEPILSRDHTERMLQRLGIPVRRMSLEDGRPRTELAPVDAYAGFEFDVPGDFSSAAFVIAAGCLSDERVIRVPEVGLNPTRTGMLDVLRRMGADVAIDNERESCGEPAGDITVRRSQLVGTRIAPAEIPALIDEIPVIGILAARATGTTVVEGAGELRFKESDRIAATVANLRAIGADAEERADGFVVHGSSGPLRGRVEARHDHRIAMAFGVLAAAGEDIVIDDRDIVAVSYPEFWRALREIGGRS